MIETFKNIYNSIVKIVKPIKEAFTDIFPRVTGQQLADITKKIKEFTSSLILNDKTSENLKNTFKGLFSVLKLGIDVIKNISKSIIKVLSNFKGLGSTIISITGSFGQWLYSVVESINKSDILNRVLIKISDTLSNIINGVKTFAIETLKINKITDIFRSLYNFIVKIATAIGNIINNMISNGNLKSGIDVVNSGIFGGLLLGLYSIVKKIKEIVGDFDSSIGSIKDILGSTKDILKAYQKEINSKVLLNIAKAVGLLAASLWLISTINAESLGRALGGMTGLIIEMVIALKAFFKILSKDNLKNIGKGSIALISMATSLLILSAALKVLSTIDIYGLAKGVLAIAFGLASMIAAVNMLPEKNIKKAASSLKSIASALVIYAVAMKILSTINFGQMGVAIIGMASGLLEMMIILNSIKPEKAISKGFAMVELATALLILSGSLKILATMDWNDIWRSISVMGIALAELTSVLLLLRFAKGSVKNAAAMVIMANSMIILAGALKILASMDWNDIWRSISVMGIALAEFTSALLLLRLAKGSITSSLSILVMANSMVILAGALKLFGKMKIGEIAKSLITIALALGIFGGAAALLSPVIPVMLGLSAAIGVFSLALVALGTGLTLIGIGLGSLKLQLIGGIDLMLASLGALIIGFAKMIPELIRIGKDIIIAFCEVIIESTPMIIKAFWTLISEGIKQLDEFMPDIISSLLDFFSKVLIELKEKMPKLISGFIEVLEAVFKGFKEAINNLDPEILSNFIENSKSLSIIFIFLAGLSKIIPSALAGVLEFGVLVVELGIVLAALGALSKIPGLNEVIGKGGNLLENIGNGIGKFVGGILGGIGSAMSSSLSTIANNLSNFMISLQPFLALIKNVDSNVLKNTTLLTLSILELSAAELIHGLTSLIPFITNNSLVKLGTSLNEFIKAALPFFMICKNTIGTDVLEGTKNLSDSLLTFAKADLKTLAGSIDKFGGNFAKFGENIKKFINITSELNIVSSVAKVQQLLSMASNVASMNVESISTFSKSLVNFAKDGVKGFCEAFSGYEPLEKARSSVKKMLDESLRIVDSKKTDFNKSFTDLMKISINSVESKKEELINMFRDLMNGSISAVESRKEIMINVFVTTCNSILNTIYSKRGPMVAVGEYFVDGFAEGIRNKSYRAINEATNMAKQALIATKKALNSHSPSKETEEIGNYFGEGFVIGIKDWFSKIYNTAFNSGELARKGLNEAIERIKAIIDNDIDTQPRITPVLDLSNIKSGVNNINSLLNSSDINRNLNAISNINLENQNRKNNDMISAINKLSDNLQSNNGNTWNIYTQELDSEKLRQIVDYINNEYGKVYN